MSMRRIYLALLLALLATSSALAQQAPCRSYYRVGEYAPPGCQDRQRAGTPVYQSWGGGFGSGPSTTPGSRDSPKPHPEWRYFGGYNALYGFGR
jgi:hypothetical protein